MKIQFEWQWVHSFKNTECSSHTGETSSCSVGSFTTKTVITDIRLKSSVDTKTTRGEEQIYDGPLASLKRFKDDVKEVRAGYECGFVFEKFNDIQEEDKVESYKMVEVPRK